MTNQQAIEAFFRGECGGSTDIHIVYMKEFNHIGLINYSTEIAYRRPDGDAVFLSGKNYSQTTSRIQNLIRREAERLGHKVELI